MAETHDEMLQVLKEKMRLEGQLEALSLEASQVMMLGGCALCLVPPGLWVQSFSAENEPRQACLTSHHMLVCLKCQPQRGMSLPSDCAGALCPRISGYA